MEAVQWIGATLWIAALVLGAYFAWAFLDCALDAACREMRANRRNLPAAWWVLRHHFPPEAINDGNGNDAMKAESRNPNYANR